MAKVRLTDRRLISRFLEITSGVLAVLSAIVIFIEIPPDKKLAVGAGILAFLAFLYLVLWCRFNSLTRVSLKIDGSVVNIQAGDIFKQPGLKVIAFNEYFDTTVDDRIIARKSLNGVFIDRYIDGPVSLLDEHIESYEFDESEVVQRDVVRSAGKNVKYRIGTTCLYKDYILAAFAKFDKSNRAGLTMQEYLEFLITFWDSVNKVYAQKSVSTTIFGSGITRIKGHKTIGDEDLLKIMLWTFRISEMRFKYPAKLTIVVHPDKIDRINLLEVKSARNGIS